MSNLCPLKIIAGVRVGWTELGHIFRYFNIAVNNCPCNLVGSWHFKLARTDRNLELIVCTYLSRIYSCWYGATVLCMSILSQVFIVNER